MVLTWALVWLVFWLAGESRLGFVVEFGAETALVSAIPVTVLGRPLEKSATRDQD
jgi:hypothetical protein